MLHLMLDNCAEKMKVIKEYKRWVRHTSWLPSNLRLRCGGTKATTPSTTPNNSSSSGVNVSYMLCDIVPLFCVMFLFQSKIVPNIGLFFGKSFGYQE
jgi:hypothetical protein